MKTLAFTKYQGTGNDFILIDNRSKKFPKENPKLIPYLCDRKFGIGSDGIILIENQDDLDFGMVFHNPDGSQSFCGNGSRCAVSFANRIGIIGEKATFMAIDGEHASQIIEHNVRVKMSDTGMPENRLEGQFIHTGSPHYVQFVSDINNFPVFEKGMAIRSKTEIFGTDGTNVNFIEETGTGSIFVRTFERGVENETMSCGTGVTAAALIYGSRCNLNKVKIESPGGELEVDFERKENIGFQEIYLTGPAVRVFDGEVTIPDNLN